MPGSDDPPPTGSTNSSAVPIGRALHLPPRLFNEDLYEAVRNLDRVHSDGVLPSMPVLLRPGLPVRGRFVVRDGVASAILIRADVAHRGFALLHEVGHFLDHAGLGTGRGFGSVGAGPELDAWRNACKESHGYRQLGPVISRAITALPPGREAERQRIERLLEPDECWARAYAQYVATRSGDASLLTGLEAARTPEPGRVSHVLQWADDDFRSIAATIDALFERLGWRTTPVK